ncbi:hypothetical protein K501DRAFT_222067 [Backusella circina FSU 941]|nr:hypothetical protein K501DRAFT_222067 [Backusella circina FSU 941]
MSTSTSNNTSGGCTYRFLKKSLADLPEQLQYHIEIRQQPERAKMSVINERDRRPIEPPPILQLHLQNCSDQDLKKCLQSPFYFMVANIVKADDPNTVLSNQEYLSGSAVSSLYRLRDIDNTDGGFFVFGDLAVKKEGKFQLKFSLFEIIDGIVHNRQVLISNVFTVFIPKRFPGPVEATFLSRTFSDQGVKMRIRKEHRLQSRKRKTDSNQDSDSSNYSNKKTSTVCSPAYAEPMAQHSEVHFGRWQASKNNNVETARATPNKFRHENSNSSELDPTQAFPSPESTVYNNNSQQYIPRSTTSRSYSGSSYATTTDKPRQWSSAEQSSPVMMEETHANPVFCESPTLLPSSRTFREFTPPHVTETINKVPATNLLLAKYHTCSDNTKKESPSLPPPHYMADIHHSATGNHHWGVQLPPLRAIMNDGFQKNDGILLLPPPNLHRIETIGYQPIH